MEEFITGREFSLGVVNGVAMPAIEIKVHDAGTTLNTSSNRGTPTSSPHRMTWTKASTRK